MERMRDEIDKWFGRSVCESFERVHVVSKEEVREEGCSLLELRVLLLSRLHPRPWLERRRRLFRHCHPRPHCCRCCCCSAGRCWCRGENGLVGFHRHVSPAKINSLPADVAPPSCSNTGVMKRLSVRTDGDWLVGVGLVLCTANNPTVVLMTGEPSVRP